MEGQPSVADHTRRDFLQKSTGALAVTGIAGLAGCLGDEDVHELAMGTAPEGGVFPIIGAGLGEIWNERDDLDVSTVNTTGVVRNAFLMEDGELDMGFFDSPAHWGAEHGTAHYDDPIELRTMFRLYPNTAYFVARADSDVETIEDLAGKSVGVGEEGAAIQWEADQHFELAGISDEVDREFLGFSDAAAAIQADQLDSMMTFGFIPAVMELAQTTDLVVVEFGEEYLDEFTSNHDWATQGPLPSEHLDWWDDDTLVVVKDVLVSAHERVPDDIVYTLVEEVFENVEQAQATLDLMATFNLEGAPIDMDGAATIHPGAREYYEDQGVL